MRVLRRQLLVGLLIVLLALSLPIYITYEYIENDPRFCTSCHLMREPYERWRVSAMHTQTCHKCHQQSLTESLSLVFETLIYNPQNITKHAQVNPEVCLKCHGSGDPEWIQVLDTAGHKIHFVSAGMNCTQCHGIELHVFKPSKELCTQCHNNTIKTPTMKFHCLNCHDYTGRKDKLIPDRSDCIVCHTARNVTTVTFVPHAHDNSDCTVCHKPHEQAEPIACTTCHEAPQKGLHQVPGHNECSTCHIPHTVDVDVRAVCTNCHTDKTTHMAPKPCTQCHDFVKSTTGPPKPEGIPQIPANHAGRTTCKACHEAGIAGAPTLPEEPDHAEFSDSVETCTQCHEQAKP